MKLIYTEKGLSELKKNSSSDVVHTDAVVRPTPSSVKPYSIRILALTKQSNQSRLSQLKTTCSNKILQYNGIQAQTPKIEIKVMIPSSSPSSNNINLQLNSFGSKSNLQVHKVLSASNLFQQQSPIQMIGTPKGQNGKTYNIQTDRSKTPQFSQRFRVKTTQCTSNIFSDHSIKQHHNQSIRLKSGEWFQFKNIPSHPVVVEYFSNLIQVKEKNQEDIDIDLNRKNEKHKEAAQKFQHQEKAKLVKIEQNEQQRALRYDKNIDAFWKSFQQQKLVLSDYGIDFKNFQKRQKKRQEELNIHKYSNMVPIVPNKEVLIMQSNQEVVLNKAGQLTKINIQRMIEQNKSESSSPPSSS